MRRYAEYTTSNSGDRRAEPMATPGKTTLTERLGQGGAGASYAQGGQEGSGAPAAASASGGAAADRPVLAVGSTGPAVVELQQKLQITADGQFGPQTRAAVVAFQQASGLAADGVVGPMTWAALDGVAAPAPVTSPAPTAEGPAPATGGEHAIGGEHTTGGEHASGNEHAVGDQPAPEPASAGGARAAIVAAARSKIGTVFSDVAAAPDETGDATRKGWETLTEIFDVAYPSFPKQIIKYIKYGKNNGEDGSKSNGLVSWCGIFATWAVMTGGGNCGTWDSGPRCSSMSKITRDPRPGDVGYFITNSHHCIIASVNGDQIETIDGNSFDGAGGGNGAITSRMRTRKEFAGFFKQVDD